ncbi:MAG: mechanosensitive ion channel family protein [Chloroflexi bacterium]|nr:mechanosensitive ion channel family protein [Chloroflexota bacterium]MQC26364.1 mechanosensitive ion channel family protein [Chloroflexota bacterium]
MSFPGLSQAEWQEVGISALVVLGAVVIGRILIKAILLPILGRLFGRSRSSLDDNLLEAASAPAYWLLILAAFKAAINRLDFLDLSMLLSAENTAFALYVLIFFVLAWRIITALTTWYTQEFAQRTDTELGQQLMPFISRVALILLTVIAGIILLGHFNIEVSGLVATLGIGSLAIALAAQAALADTISGFIIMIDRPFRIGDRIELLELNTWGDVMDIGLRSTRIRTRDNRMAIVPNSVIGKSLVVNHSFPDNTYRLEIEVGVAYGTDIEKARAVLVDAVSQVDGVLKDQPVEALFLEFGSSALIFRVRWWLDSYVETRRMFDWLNTAIYKALNEAGIVIPFPQQDVHHKIDSTQQMNFAKLINQRK